MTTLASDKEPIDNQASDKEPSDKPPPLTVDEMKAVASSQNTQSCSIIT